MSYEEVVTKLYLQVEHVVFELQFEVLGGAQHEAAVLPVLLVLDDDQGVVAPRSVDLRQLVLDLAFLHTLVDDLLDLSEGRKQGGVRMRQAARGRRKIRVCQGG